VSVLGTVFEREFYILKSIKTLLLLGKTIKQQKFDWKIFDLTNLTLARIDVNYLRESKIIDTNQSIEMLVGNMKKQL